MTDEDAVWMVHWTLETLKHKKYYNPCAQEKFDRELLAKVRGDDADKRGALKIVHRLVNDALESDPASHG